MEELLNKVDSLLWGPVTIVFLVRRGIFMTGLVRGIHLCHFIYAFGLLSGKYDNPKGKGEITHFQALSAALSATIGTGNISAMPSEFTGRGREFLKANKRARETLYV
ncbi:MAG: alanine:cation symporter family protein [bacterium]|nr:alanine:cation symporter family protein [bacterium]